MFGSQEAIIGSTSNGVQSRLASSGVALSVSMRGAIGTARLCSGRNEKAVILHETAQQELRPPISWSTLFETVGGPAFPQKSLVPESGLKREDRETLNVHPMKVVRGRSRQPVTEGHDDGRHQNLPSRKAERDRRMANSD